MLLKEIIHIFLMAVALKFNLLNLDIKQELHLNEKKNLKKMIQNNFHYKKECIHFFIQDKFLSNSLLLTC